MRYRRALFVTALGGDVAPHVAVLRRVAPALEHLLVVAELPTPALAWLFGEPHPAPDDRTTASLEALRTATVDVAPSREVQVSPELGSEALAALEVSAEIDLLVFGERSVRSAWLVSVERAHQHAAVLWSEGEAPTGPLREIVCVALDERSRGELGAFLRDETDPSMHVTVLTPTAVAPDALATALQVSGIETTVDVSSLHDAPSMQRWLDDWRRDWPVDLLVCASVSALFLVAALRDAPVLLLPSHGPARPFGERAIDVPDLLDDGGPIRVRVDQVQTVGSLAPVPDQAVAFVASGHVVATAETVGGEAELPAGLSVDSLGVYRVGESAPEEPLAAIEQRVAVVRGGERPLVLVDCELADDALRTLAGLCDASAADVLAIRLRPTRACHAIRERLRAAGLPPRVLDARLVLDEGEALDVSDMLDAVRLARAASRLRRAGFPVSAIVHRGDIDPSVDGFLAVRAAALDANPSLSLAAPPTQPTAPASTTGNRVELELDNALARGWLLEAIGQATSSLHFQVYMALDDDVGGPVEAALAAAGARGVTVRVLVDSLHGLHGSFGTRNPLLDRLAARPGVELRILRPITELPSIADLKQRDHRKLVVADGRLALLGGRNLSHEYYTAFREVQLTPASPWRQVPWLDAGARVEGPAVGALQASFLATWSEAGGSQFEVTAPPGRGTTEARVVIHRGLRDVRTLETYLDLIESAKSHIYAVNGFPLLLELQHALVRAIRRGVQVRALIGHATPMYGDQAFSGPWAAARTAATELVHSRMDPIIAAGGETFLFARSGIPGWAPDLGVVHPHVHAKMLSVDGLRCSVGSANMDVTASYWESELLLVVEDAGLTGALEDRIGALMADSTLVRRDDPAWKQLAARRAWMRHWPGVLSV